MTRFRPCIDLHQGCVKQIVGGSLTDSGAQTNFVSEHSGEYYAALYREHNLTGGHVISLGNGNQEAALAALKAWPNGLQYGGGVRLDNAESYLNAGASHVIVTSSVFDGAQLSWQKLKALSSAVGKSRLVLDVSCRRTEQGWFIATNRWQTVTDTPVNRETLEALAEYCDEFLIHAADVEGLQAGIDAELVSLLGACALAPMTYAGGARSLDDLQRVQDLSSGKVDLTIGSALDIFGGQGVTIEQCVRWNNA